MNQKIGRNDPCPCGSGKKYKSCCQSKVTSGSTLASLKNRKITAKWINAPQGPDLIERMFGDAIASTGKKFAASENLEQEKSEKNEEFESPEASQKE
jgi:hypothetical protein